MSYTHLYNIVVKNAICDMPREIFLLKKKTNYNETI